MSESRSLFSPSQIMGCFRTHMSSEVAACRQLGDCWTHLGSTLCKMTHLAACIGACSHEEIRHSHRNTGVWWLLMNDNKSLLLRQRKINGKANVNGSVSDKAGRPRDGGGAVQSLFQRQDQAVRGKAEVLFQLKLDSPWNPFLVLSHGMNSTHANDQ